MIRFIAGDVVDVAIQMNVPGRKARLIFSDPPYDLGFDYGRGKAADKIGMKAYIDWSRQWIAAYAELLEPGGTMMVLVREKHADAIGSVMTELVGPRRSRVIWHETFSQYNPHSFGNAHRHLFYHVRPGGKHTWHPDPIRVPSRRMEMGDKRAAGPRVPDDVWTFPRLCGSFKARVDWHPAQLPAALLERCMLPTTTPGDLVIEPFSGSGTLGVLCRDNGRHYIGIDNSDEYIRKSVARVIPEVSA